MARCPRCGAMTDPTVDRDCPACGEILSDPGETASSMRPGGLLSSTPDPPAAEPPRDEPPRRVGPGGGLLKAIGIPIAIVAALAAGYLIYDVVGSSDGDDAGASGGPADVDSGTEEVVDIEAAAIAVGDCIDWPGDDLVDTVAGVPCDQPHDAEVYAMPLLTAGPEVAYPGFDGLVDEAVGLCVQAFEGYVGVAYEADQEHDFDFFSPTEESWAAGDREIVCLVYRIDEADITGSVRAGG